MDGGTDGPFVTVLSWMGGGMDGPVLKVVFWMGRGSSCRVVEWDGGWVQGKD